MLGREKASRIIDPQWPDLYINHGHWWTRKAFNREQLDDPSSKIEGWLKVEPVFSACGQVDVAGPQCDIWVTTTHTDGKGTVAYVLQSEAGVRYSADMISATSTGDKTLHGPSVAEFFNLQLVKTEAYISQIGQSMSRSVKLPSLWHAVKGRKKTLQCWDLPKPRFPSE